MAKKEFTYRGKTIEELQSMSFNELIELLPSRQRRSLKRGLSHSKKEVMKKVQQKDKNLKTHCRDMVIMPSMVGMTIKVYSGKEFVPLMVQPEMVGHLFGEFILTRKSVKHSAPGVGATKSSSSISVR